MGGVSNPNNPFRSNAALANAVAIAESTARLNRGETLPPRFEQNLRDNTTSSQAQALIARIDKGRADITKGKEDILFKNRQEAERQRLGSREGRQQTIFTGSQGLLGGGISLLGS